MIKNTTEVFKINLIIKLNSVTYALKARELLNSKGVKSNISKNPNPKKGEGCGYALSVFNAPPWTLDYLKNNKILIKDAVYK